MFHLTFKDYAFLVGIGLLLFVVGGGLLLSGNLQQQYVSQADTPSEVVQNTGTFNCDGETFQLVVPVNEFEFDSFPHIAPGIEKECFWFSSQYKIAYMKAVDLSYTHDMDEIVSRTQESENSLEYRKTNRGTEMKGYDTDKKEYAAAIFIGNGPEAYFLGYSSPYPVEFEDPNFRAFVDSFRPLN